jgi:hypothetical protein
MSKMIEKLKNAQRTHGLKENVKTHDGRNPFFTKIKK